MNALRAAWARWRDSRARDPVIAVAVSVMLVWGAYSEGHPRSLSDQVQFHGPIPAPPPAALLLVVVACLALAWRRIRPVPALAVSTLAVFAYTLLGYINGAALIAPVVALFAVTSRVSVRRAIICSAVTLALLAVPTALIDPFGLHRGFDVSGGFLLIPKSDKSREANQGSAPYSPCFEATAQVGMEEGLLRLKRMIVDFRLPIAD